MRWEAKYPFLAKIVDGLRFLGDLLAVNLLWLFTSLPIVTVGAASSAAYAVLLRYVREGDVPILKTYFQSLRENFLQATALWLISIAMAFVVYVDWRFAGTMEGSLHTLYLALSVVLCAAIAVMLTLAIPIQSYYRNSLKNIIKNAFAMAFCAPGWMLLIWLVWAALATFCLLVPFNIVLSAGSLFIMWGFSFPAWLASKITLRIFRIFDPNLKKTEETNESSGSEEES